VDAAQAGGGDRGVRPGRRSSRGRWALRYRVEMKKSSTTKLVVRRETLRALSNVDLARAAGGDAVMLPESGDKGCAVLVAPQPPGG
jgi:hypothetical protein